MSFFNAVIGLQPEVPKPINGCQVYAKITQNHENYVTVKTKINHLHILLVKKRSVLFDLRRHC